ncbi:uncharacterized protein EAE98_009367 [Botrytis deweyae]|uniref:Manganese/iron superoxide dismutase C-terminal domain-containing protein n=2 Tax=Botrytis TaxID=33196 RepID=A0A4Z1JYG4_9HELO|nr:uncharacterized protein EAE98_009367 [Botrytis deweyae]KAF7915756.1 hypothetical protein EAE99_010007 [Botrytis elliptica]KAF7919527.1 hypothetical protein EAE98_009367 [Botrytis deweyae]TGO78214.1 hypothetical protein BELL_0074g00030 [Botrytis elliptica]
MFRSRFPRIGRSVQKNFFRSISQHVPPLKHDFTNGIPEFIGPQAFELSWTSYQKLMVDKLSDAIAGVPHLDGKQPKEIALLCARDPDQAATFNYASMAFNNNFFFNCLQPNPVSEPVMSEKLRAAIENSFSSVDGLKREFVITASKMFGPGFVWLMKDRFDRLSLMTTYLAGSPFPGAHHRRQPKDMNTESESVTDFYRQKLAAPPVNTVGAHGHLSKERKPPGGIEVTPILCVNTWEHVWIADYGMGTDDIGGKKVYVENWWNVIDWSVVADLAALSGNSASKLERN